MANFEKNLTKYTKTYIKRIEKSNFSEEEKTIYKTIGLMNVNSLLYFIAAIEESDSQYTGVHINKWKVEQKKISEKDIHDILSAITREYFLEALDSSQSLIYSRLELWSNNFQDLFHMKIEEEEREKHLVDVVFEKIGLMAASRNEMTVMTFVQIISSLYQRVDKTLEKIVKE